MANFSCKGQNVNILGFTDQGVSVAMLPLYPDRRHRGQGSEGAQLCSTETLFTKQAAGLSSQPLFRKSHWDKHTWQHRVMQDSLRGCRRRTPSHRNPKAQSSLGCGFQTIIFIYTVQVHKSRVFSGFPPPTPSNTPDTIQTNIKERLMALLVGPSTAKSTSWFYRVWN